MTRAVSLTRERVAIGTEEIEGGVHALNDGGELVDLDIGQPVIEDEGLWHVVLELCKSLASAVDFTHLPPHGGEGRAKGRANGGVRGGKEDGAQVRLAVLSCRSRENRGSHRSLSEVTRDGQSEAARSMGTTLWRTGVSRAAAMR